MSNILSGKNDGTCPDAGMEKRIRPRSPLPSWRLRRVRAHIETRLFDRLYVSELARVAGLSQMHFAAQFREAVGVSPHAYVVKRRVEEAQRLMLDETRSIVSIALEVGFSNQAHFTRAFKKQSGMPPKRWRLELFDWFSMQETPPFAITNPYLATLEL